MKLTEGLASRAFTVSFKPTLSQPSPRFDEAVTAIRKAWPDVIPDRSSADRRATLARVAQHHAVGDWTGVKRSDVLVAARVAFDAETISEPEYERFRAFLVDQAELTDSMPFVRAMFAVYLEAYEPGGSHTRALSRALGTNRGMLGLSERLMLERMPELLDAKSAPGLIAGRLAYESDPGATLRAWGFRDLYSTGLMHHLHLAFVLTLAAGLAKAEPTVFARLLRWVKPDGEKPRVHGAEAAIVAALSPWVRKEPSSDYQQALVSGLTVAYGDSRLSTSAAWSKVPPEYRQLMARWLTGTTMALFLEAISRSNEEDMWNSRKKFWMGLYEAGHIDEAWVAFSDQAYRVAQRLASTPEERVLYGSFGRQTAGGNRKNTSLLVMRIGSRTIVEGSHNYKVQLFERSNPARPGLYESGYDCERLRHLSDADKVHSGSSWQNWVRQKVL